MKIVLGLILLISVSINNVISDIKLISKIVIDPSEIVTCITEKRTSVLENVSVKTWD